MVGDKGSSEWASLARSGLGWAFFGLEASCLAVVSTLATWQGCVAWHGMVDWMRWCAEKTVCRANVYDYGYSIRWMPVPKKTKTQKGYNGMANDSSIHHSGFPITVLGMFPCAVRLQCPDPVVTAHHTPSVSMAPCDSGQEHS